MEARMRKRGDGLRAWNEAQRAAKHGEVAAPTADATSGASDAGTLAASVLRPLTPRQVAGRLAALGCDPLAIMAKLAKNAHLDPTLRVALARHLAAYQIAQAPTVAGDKALPALGDVIAAAWRKPKAAAQFTAQAKAKSAAATRKRKATKR